MTKKPVLLLMCTSLLFSCNELFVSGKHIAVFGGLMKSHHLSVVPFIEGLVERGHQVSFVIPNTTEFRSLFRTGVSNAKMVYLGEDEWSFDTVFAGPEYDIKNLPWLQKPIAIFKMLWTYREAFKTPVLSMHDQLVPWLKATHIDAILLHTMSVGSLPLVRDSGIPWVSYFSLPPLPVFVSSDKETACRYPNFLRPPSVSELKLSLMARVKNYMECQFAEFYMSFIGREIQVIVESRGLRISDTIYSMINEAPQAMFAGGPPLSLPVKLPPKMHVLGTISKPGFRQSVIPSEMLIWLDAASRAEAQVLYVSMGTKYELHEHTCSKLVNFFDELKRILGIRILWSLRASQQKLLSHLLPDQSESVRLELFTPQPDVLKHPSVKVFLSHCGWGGVTDALNAGVPVLGYPGMSDQFSNARMLEQAGAGIIIANDFSNLVESVKLILTNATFAIASRTAGENLNSYGGLDRAIEIIEAAAIGEHLTPDPDVLAKVTDVDPFFEKPQPLTKLISFAIFMLIILFGLLICSYCCRCCWKICRCSSRHTDHHWTKKQKNN